VLLVDELAHTNAPGSRHPKRWMDVEELLDSGIDVYTTVNIQHLESLNDVVAQITGVRVRETVPDWIVKQADEVVLVDLTPQALLNRLERGVVYAPDRAQKALQHFFKESTLGALRELGCEPIGFARNCRELDAECPRRRIDLRHLTELRSNNDDERCHNRSVLSKLDLCVGIHRCQCFANPIEADATLDKPDHDQNPECHDQGVIKYDAEEEQREGRTGPIGRW
jgi:hypothetical protein